MPTTPAVPTLATYQRLAEAGTHILSPDDLANLEVATNKLSPRTKNVDPVELMVLITAGLVANRFAEALNRVVDRAPLPADLPAGAERPRPSWAIDVMAEFGFGPPPPPPGGPVNTREELHRRAAAAGLVLP